MAGHIKASLTAWDKYLAQHPEQSPYHWQRGIALYYAERYADGRAQFESHVKVNPQDVENSVWHYLCVARQQSLAAAQKALLPVEKDLRVPMREVMNLFAGKGTAAEVLAAAQAMPETSTRRRDALCYAHLYLGLYEEAQGHTDAAKGHLLKAAVDYAMPHYMGEVAKIHCKLRGWLDPKTETK
jgi:lipoprotein NlpI